jgi:TolA-binding protein
MKCSFLVLLATTSTLLLSAEPSAFGAGDLNNPQPYGLTSNEKVILETKDKLHKVALKSNNQENKLDSLRERIDGMQSILESLSRKTHKNKINLQNLQNKHNIYINSRDEYEKRLSELVQTNNQEIDRLKEVISKMSLLIDEINTQYVTKDEFNSLVNDVNKFKELIIKELKSSKSKPSKSKLSSMKSSEIYNKAKAYFDKKYYTKAIEYYQELIKRKYKPAYSHYMIGEMNFKRKNYSNAISYFKKSSSLYSKASYMPKLMLHTAISMDKTGDKSHAKAFYEAILKKYPNSKEAKEAKKYLGL